MPDIDIDFADRSSALALFKHFTASIKEDGTFKKHNTGVYCTAVPHNPLTGLSTVDYKAAEDRGYFKIDFLNVNVYNGVRDEQHLTALLDQEPIWDLLSQKEFCDLIFHVNGYHSMIARLKPQSIEQLAMFLALIRPGKKHLVTMCQDQGWSSIAVDIWSKTNDTYSFKKSHAVAYAHAIVVQMNLICETLSAN